MLLKTVTLLQENVFFSCCVSLDIKVVVCDVTAIKSRADKGYVLNAKSKQLAEDQTPHIYVNVGALWTYERKNDVEFISTKGPTNSVVYVMVSFL